MVRHNGKWGLFMTLEQSILNAVRALPPEKQAEVLKIAESLKQNAESKQPRKPGRGLWEDLGFSLSAEEIDEARKEMWADFPRNDI
jgi:hypothetical protein